MKNTERNLKELFEEFINIQKFTKCLRPETLRGYRQIVDTFMRMMPEVIMPSDITTSTIVDFYRKLQTRTRIIGKDTEKTGVRQSTILTYRQKTRLFFEWLKNNGYIAINPLNKIPFPKVVYEDIRYLTKDEVNRIFTAILLNPQKNPLVQKRDILMFYILLYCGIRKSELQGLEIRDFDLNAKMLTVRGEISKSKISRRIPLHPTTIFHLKDYLKERSRCKTPFLLVSGNADRGLSSHGLKHWVKRMIKISGVKFHLHRFRHTFATNFLNSTHTNNNIIKLKELLGHKDIKMTLVYLRGLPATQMSSDIENLSIDNLI